MDTIERTGAVAGPIHGDVKPSNVQLCADGRVVLVVNFGLPRTRLTGPAVARACRGVD